MLYVVLTSTHTLQSYYIQSTSPSLSTLDQFLCWPVMYHDTIIPHEACSYGRERASRRHHPQAGVRCGLIRFQLLRLEAQNYTLTRLAFSVWVLGLRLRPNQAKRQRLSLSNFTFLQRHSSHQVLYILQFQQHQDGRYGH